MARFRIALTLVLASLACTVFAQTAFADPLTGPTTTADTYAVAGAGPLHVDAVSGVELREPEVVLVDDGLAVRVRSCHDGCCAAGERGPSHRYDPSLNASSSPLYPAPPIATTMYCLSCQR